MAWHEYRAGTPEQRAELLELWDIGGLVAHRQTAQVFFEGAVGAILVHDLTNRRSEENLATWLTMLDGKPRTQQSSKSKDPAAVALRVDIESCNIPVLIVGTKADLVPHKGPVSYDRLHVDSLKNILRGSSNSITLARFFDSCLDRTRRTSASTAFMAKSRTITPNSSILASSGNAANGNTSMYGNNRSISPFTTISMGS
uniref:Uncharacterized protein n=1 Tax=Caenorhabditis japonica TaxID=281687 RepID=A0A8R1I3B8_CAEJA